MNRLVLVAVCLFVSQCATQGSVRLSDFATVCVNLCETEGGMDVYRFGIECKENTSCVQDKYEMLRCWCKNGANFHRSPKQ